jgi:signal peptidase I
MEPDHAENKQESRSFGKSVWEWAKVIVIALLISLPIRFFIAEPFVVNGASMDPAFSTGQFLIVDRLTYRLESPKRGDVIVFEYPDNPSIYYIKRIIGLPGETLDIKDGSVAITTVKSSTAAAHTEVLNESYIAPIHASHDTYHIALGPTEYFVMGDNRAQSSDSRVWGPLDSQFIIGRPIVRLFPLNTLSILPGKEDQ